MAEYTSFNDDLVNKSGRRLDVCSSAFYMVAPSQSRQIGRFFNSLFGMVAHSMNKKALKGNSYIFAAFQCICEATIRHQPRNGSATAEGVRRMGSLSYTERPTTLPLKLGNPALGIWPASMS